MICKVGTKDCGFDLIVLGQHSKHWNPYLSAGADITRETQLVAVWGFPCQACCTVLPER